MPTFHDIYTSMRKKQKSLFIQQVIKETEIASMTFFMKRRNNSFTKLEREKISEIIGEPVTSLFPEKEKSFY